MPELPEVETVRREIENALLYQTIQQVEVRERRLRTFILPTFEQNLLNLTVNSVRRRAKYILIEFKTSPFILIIHLGMSGRIHLSRPTSLLMSPQKHEHVIFTFQSGQVLKFFDPRRFGSLEVLSALHPKFNSLGPEPLSPEFTAKILKEKLQNKKTSMKTALLDQRVVAGLGNIYVCEALHQAKIHPEKMGKCLDLEECERVVRAIKSVLLQAITAGGSTLRDHQRTDGTSGSFQNHFKVYGRIGKECPGCFITPIQRIKQSNRSTFFCPLCQSENKDLL